MVIYFKHIRPGELKPTQPKANALTRKGDKILDRRNSPVYWLQTIQYSKEHHTLKHENAAGMQKLWCHLTSTVGAAGTEGGGGGLVDNTREDSSIRLLLLTGCCCKQSTSPLLLPIFVNPEIFMFKMTYKIMKS